MTGTRIHLCPPPGLDRALADFIADMARAQVRRDARGDLLDARAPSPRKSGARERDTAPVHSARIIPISGRSPRR